MPTSVPVITGMLVGIVVGAKWEPKARFHRPEYMQQSLRMRSDVFRLQKEGIAPAMTHKWIQLMFCGLALASITSCSPAQLSPLVTGITPLPDTPEDKPPVISPTGSVEPHSLEASTPQWTANPITRTQSGGTQEPPVMSSVPISIPLEPALQQVVTQAREDLARRLGVPVDSVTVDAVIGQEFSTDAFSCRTSKDRISKDESPQVISGQSILLTASVHRYEYHASGQTIIFCRPLP